MKITGKRMARVAQKLGYAVKEGSKHIVVHDGRRLVTTLPRGKIKAGTLHDIVKELGITEAKLKKLL